MNSSEQSSTPSPRDIMDSTHQGKVENVWDEIVQAASSRSRESTTGLCKLPLVREPRWIHKPSIVRELSEVPQEIRDDFRGLVSGLLPWPYFLSGTVGIGKSLAALCLCDHSRSSVFTTVDELCEDLSNARRGQLSPKSDYAGRTLSPLDVWLSIARVELLVVDEIGEDDEVWDSRRKVLRRVLDERHGKPLLLISNLKIKKLAELYDDRIASRMSAGTVRRIDAPDRRLEGK